MHDFQGQVIKDTVSSAWALGSFTLRRPSHYILRIQRQLDGEAHVVRYCGFLSGTASTSQTLFNNHFSITLNKYHCQEHFAKKYILCKVLENKGLLYNCNLLYWTDQKPTHQTNLFTIALRYEVTIKVPNTGVPGWRSHLNIQLLI